MPIGRSEKLATVHEAAVSEVAERVSVPRRSPRWDSSVSPQILAAKPKSVKKSRPTQCQPKLQFD
jgi:hypothetical protein